MKIENILAEKECLYYSKCRETQTIACVKKAFLNLRLFPSQEGLELIDRDMQRCLCSAYPSTTLLVADYSSQKRIALPIPTNLGDFFASCPGVTMKFESAD